MSVEPSQRVLMLLVPGSANTFCSPPLSRPSWGFLTERRPASAFLERLALVCGAETGPVGSRNDNETLPVPKQVGAGLEGAKTAAAAKMLGTYS